MVQSGLYRHWPLHEWSGRANDLSGNDGHATTTTLDAQGVAGRSGLTASQFDGSSSRVDFGALDAISGSDQVTVSMWARTDRISGDRQDAINASSTQGGRLAIRISTFEQGDIQWYAFDGTQHSCITDGGAIQPNEWTHIVGTYDGNLMKLYLNGELVQTQAEDFTYDTIGDITIGVNPSGPNSWYDGEISDVRIYTRPISPSEVQTLYRIGSVDVATPPNGSDASAVSRWSFDDRSDTSTALDEWGSNDGTINGATYSQNSIRGLSMSFDGSNDYLDMADPSSLDNMSEVTLTGWFNSNTTSSNTQIAGIEFVYKMMYDDSNELRVLTSSDGSTWTYQTQGGNITSDGWYFAAMTHSTSELKAYLNGVNVASTSTGNPLSSNSNKFMIGANDDGTGSPTGFFNGNIEDVRVYNRTLSEYEIQQLYQWGTRGVDRRFEVMQQ